MTNSTVATLSPRGQRERSYVAASLCFLRSALTGCPEVSVYLRPRWTSDRDGHASAASIKFELALTYPIIAISRSSKSWRRSKRRNDGKLNRRSCGRHTGSVSRIASRSCHLKYCLSTTIRWYCTSNVYFRATHWINPIYYEVPACDCRCIRPRPRQDATIVWVAVVGYRQCCRLSIAGQQYDSCGCGSCC